MKKAILLLSIFSFLFVACEKDDCDCLYDNPIIGGTSWERISYGDIDSVDVSRETNVNYIDLGKRAMWEERLVFGARDYIYTSKLFVSDKTKMPDVEIEFDEDDFRNDDFGFNGTYTYQSSIVSLFAANGSSILTGALSPDSISIIFVEDEQALIFLKQ